MHRNMQRTRACKPRERISMEQSTHCENTYGIPKRFAFVTHRSGLRISVKTTFYNGQPCDSFLAQFDVDRPAAL